MSLTRTELEQVHRKTWTKLAEALTANKLQETDVVELIDKSSSQSSTYELRINGTKIPNYVLTVMRDSTSHTTAVPGWHDHTYKNTYSIHVSGIAGSILFPKKRFPQKKDGGHNYTTAAQYFWAVRTAEKTAHELSKSREALRTHNKALVEQLPKDLKYSRHAIIGPSMTTQGKLNVEVHYNRELTVEQTKRLIALLRQFDVNLEVESED